MILVLNFLKSNWFIISIVMSAVALYFYVVGLQNKVKELDLMLDIERNKTTSCHVQIDKNNKIIDEWNDKSVLKQNEMKLLQTELNKSTIENNKHINELLIQDTVSSCDDAIKYLVDGVKHD